MGIENATPQTTKPQTQDESPKAGQSGAQSGNEGMQQKTGATGEQAPRTEDDGKPIEGQPVPGAPR